MSEVKKWKCNFCRRIAKAKYTLFDHILISHQDRIVEEVFEFEVEAKK